MTSRRSGDRGVARDGRAPAGPGTSWLAAGAARRLALALALGAGLWLAVGWALGWFGGTGS